MRESLEAWLASVPPAPHWLGAVPFAGPSLTSHLDRLGHRPFGHGRVFPALRLGLIAERGLSLLLGIAGGFAHNSGVALFAAFFFWINGRGAWPPASAAIWRIKCGRQICADHLIQATANDGARRSVWHSGHRHSARVS